jgi:Gram-negative bacterial TonB protein C-terminal
MWKKYASLCFVVLSSMVYVSDVFAQSVVQSTAPTPTEAISPATADVAVPDMQFDGDQQSWARVRRIVTPTYPKDAIEKNIGTVIDIEVLIDEGGSMKELRSIESTPKNVQFEEITRAVLKYWTFWTAISSRCQPIQTVGAARLNFSVQNGEGKIELSHRKLTERAKTPLGPRLVAINSAAVRGAVRYPTSARRVGATASVWVIATIDPSTGKTSNVEASAVRSNWPSMEDDFAQTSIDAAKRLQFEPIPNYVTPLKMCVPFEFSLVG